MGRSAGAAPEDFSSLSSSKHESPNISARTQRVQLGNMFAKKTVFQYPTLGATHEEVEMMRRSQLEHLSDQQQNHSIGESDFFSPLDGELTVQDYQT